MADMKDFAILAMVTVTTGFARAEWVEDAR
jgi:hypothetical protein